MLLDYLSTEGLFCMNIHFKKSPQRKWTSKSSNNIVKNEIDYFLTNNKEIYNDVSVLNQFSTDSDLRLVSAKTIINTKLDRRKLIKNHICPTSPMLEQKSSEYQKVIRKKVEPTKALQLLDELSARITRCSRGKRGVHPNQIKRQ